VQAERLVVNDGGHRQGIKRVHERLPHLFAAAAAAILSQALVLKAVDFGNLPGFVAAAQQVDALGEGHLERQQQRRRLDSVQTAVHIAPEEQIVRVGWLSI
jgi:hypothetical protein